MAESKNFFDSLGISPVQVLFIGGGIWGGYKVAQKFGLVDSKEKEKETALLAAPYLSPSYVLQLQQDKKKFTAYSSTSFPQLLAKQIRDSKGLFNDNESRLWAALKRIQFKTQAAVVSYWFTKQYGEDLTQYLNTFQSKEEMAKIFDYLEKLPSGVI